ncbi:MAG: hypothetical protein ABC536_06370 [Candidatus Methanosuratincola petrocarbonis]
MSTHEKTRIEVVLHGGFNAAFRGCNKNSIKTRLPSSKTLTLISSEMQKSVKMQEAPGMKAGSETSSANSPSAGGGQAKPGSPSCQAEVKKEGTERTARRAKVKKEEVHPH